MLNSSTLRPGLLVSLKTTLTGNVSYDKRDIERDHVTGNGALEATWETTRVIADPSEHEAATKVRSQASAAIRGVCAKSAFGLLCPEQDAAKLERAIATARGLADDFNGTAKLSRIGVYVITGRIAADDVEAVRAISSEMRDLLAEMEAGVRNLDVAAIRDAANRARSVGQMLSPQAAERVQGAIEAARAAARKISKAGEQAALTVDQNAIRALTNARTQFLDLDEPARGPVVSVDLSPAPAIDFEPQALPRATATTAGPLFEVDGPEVDGPRFEME